MKSIALLSVLGIFALVGCTGQAVAVKSAAAIYLTRPDEPPPADTQHQIQEHETWCYKTMADTDCYARAQDVAPNRLVNVEPQNLRPLTPDAYRDEVAGRRPAPATAKPAPLNASKEDKPAEQDKSADGPYLIERVTGYDMPFLHGDSAESAKP